MNIQPGQKLGPYTIGRLLGAGAMGVVYEAVDARLDRTVALKLISEELSRVEEFRRRLAQEASRAAKIDSPYVVKVWEYGESDDRSYVSLELVPGPTLREAAGHLTQEQKLDLVVQLAAGIQAAHDAGVVHRDLKPENLKVGDAGQVRILDFGLAIAERGETVTASGDIEGTIAYSSPEQLSGGAVTASSDLFSFGVVLYELFTGRRPFEGAYSAAVVYSILYEDPPSPQEVRKAIPTWLNDLIIDLLRKRPEDRPASAQEAGRIVMTNRKVVDEAFDLPRGLRRRRSVTVEELKNLSGDDSWAYFCEAFSDDLVASLTQRTALVVGAQPSKARPSDLHERFARYRCDYLVTGTLSRWQEKIRLTLSVYGEGGDRVISKSTFEGVGEQLFTLLASAAEDTAEILAAVSGTQPRERVDGEAPDVAAYDYYMKGRSYYQTNRPEDLERAEKLYRKALEIDANLAAAHAGLSDVYVFQYMAYYDHRAETIERAREEAMLALEKDRTLPEAHRSLGRCYMFCNEPEKAEAAFLRAIESNPKYAIGYRTLAWLKSMYGDPDAALNGATKALKLAPTDLETLLLISDIHMERRTFTPALATLQRAIELGPDYGRAYYALGTVYMRLGVPEPALENFLQAVRYQGDPNAYHDAGYVYMVLGKSSEGQRILEEGIAAGRMPFICHYYLAIMARLAGDTTGAARHVEAAMASIQADDPTGTDPHLIAYRAAVLAEQGDAETARKLITGLGDNDELTGGDWYCLSRACASMGDAARMRVFLHRAIESPKGPTAQEVALDPILTRQGGLADSI